MRSLIAAIAACVMLCAQVIAAPLDSSVSGVYLAPDRVCNVVVSRASLPWDGVMQRWWVSFDMQCLTSTGQFKTTRLGGAPNIQYVYTGCPSYGAGATIADYSAVTYEYTSIRSGNAQSLQVIRSNDQNAAINGVGTLQTWIKIGPLASPDPYTCQGGTIGKPRG